MPYIEELYKAGNIIEIHKFYTYQNHPKGMKRAVRHTITPENMRRSNQKSAERKLRRILCANFKANTDYSCTLTFSKENMPENDKEFNEIVRKFLRRLRIECNKQGITPKYVYTKEKGKRKGYHVHMVVSGCSPEQIRKCWNWGRVYLQVLYQEGEFADLANYMCKAGADDSPVELIGKRWNCSRNILHPKAKRKVISANTYREEPRAKKGYHVEKDSIQRWENPETGYMHLLYYLITDDKTTHENISAPFPSMNAYKNG